MEIASLVERVLMLPLMFYEVKEMKVTHTKLFYVATITLCYPFIRVLKLIHYSMN